MAEVDDQFVKRGYWMKYEQGPLLGGTVTVEARWANVIIAALTILVAFASAQLWGLLVFLYHQVRATGEPSDGLFWQQQVLLRKFDPFCTLPTPTSLITASIKLWWTWRHKTSKPFIRSLLLLIFALLFAIGTITASLFATYVIDTLNIEVLVNRAHCGAVNLSQHLSTGAEEQLCGTMKIRKAYGFANINVFGLSFILATCALLTFLNIFILRFFIFLSPFRRALTPRFDRWIQDGVFQLQRRAFDANGEGKWLHIDEEIPSTFGLGQLLNELPFHSSYSKSTKATARSEHSRFGSTSTIGTPYSDFEPDLGDKITTVAYSDFEKEDGAWNASLKSQCFSHSQSYSPSYTRPFKEFHIPLSSSTSTISLKSSLSRDFYVREVPLPPPPPVPPMPKIPDSARVRPSTSRRSLTEGVQSPKGKNNVLSSLWDD